MRTRHLVVSQDNIVSLMDLTSSLLICDPGEEEKQRAHDAVETVREQLINGASPFITYRSEVLAFNGGGVLLQALVLHLWNDKANTLRLGALLRNLDNLRTQVALEMIVSYARCGENDPDFMRLAAEIRDIWTTDAAQNAERILGTYTH